MTTPADIAAFITRWERATLTERSAAQSHFIDLCRVLGVPTPAEMDQQGDEYTFEKLTGKDNLQRGFADVWYRNHFAWEYKKVGGDLDKALAQLRAYSGALGNPPLLVVSDMQLIRIVPQFTGYVTTPEDFTLADLRDPRKLERLRNLWRDPFALQPALKRDAVTLEASRQFAVIAERLRTKDQADPHTVAHFLIRILFCLFAENIGLLPRKHFTASVESFRYIPDSFVPRVAKIFRVMADPEDRLDGNVILRYFNGDLFTRAQEELVRLNLDDLAILWHATAHDWSSVAPTIFGTLFERGLDPEKRSQIGAHYTGETDILAVVEPVVMAPLRRQWDDTRAQLDDLAARGKAGSKDAHSLLAHMQEAIRTTTVLDPACGSGNFLYVTLRLLHDLEQEVRTWYAEHHLNLPIIMVHPDQLYGMDINPYAAELAKAVIWIGHLQWMIEHGELIPEPVLSTLNNINECDALLADGDLTNPRRAPWPAATCIVSNPPFLGDKVMRSTHGDNRGGLGDAYVDALRSVYGEDVPGGADLVCYFVAHAWEQMQAGKYQRVGMITTNSIRGGANRRVLDTIKSQGGDLFMAWADRPWYLDGAAVRISMIGFDKGQETSRTLNGHRVGAINSDLTSSVDLTQARRLLENSDIAFIGTQKSGDFDIDAATAQSMLALKGNPNGRPNSDVIRPWMNGQDIVRRPRDMYIIDFNDLPIEQAALYEAPFEYVKQHVKELRMLARRDHYRIKWWLYGENRPGMRGALSNISRYIISPRVAKHRIFAWVDVSVLPDSATVAIARDDDYTFGVLHSKAHELWSLRMCTWLGVGNDPRYTPTTCFETFPFPRPSDAQREAIAAAARQLVAQRDAWLNPDGASADDLKKRTLTALYNARPQWLLNAHATLDRAVCAAYGWPDSVTDDDILARLLAENLRRAAGSPAPVAITADGDEATDDEA